MIGKAKSNKSLIATINYNLKENAELVFTNQLHGENIQDYQLEMQLLQKCYPGKARQLTIHVILSPHINEGKSLTKEQWKTMADKYLKEMKLNEHQAIGFVHSDKEHRHLHLVINKVRDAKLKLFHDAFIGKRSQHAADRIALQMKLTRAMELRNKNIERRQKRKTSQIISGHFIEPEQALSKPLGSKQLFKQQLKNLLAKTSVTTIDDYFREIQKSGYKLHLYSNKETNELRGYGIEMNNTKMDASTIGKEFTLTKLYTFFEEKHRLALELEEENKMMQSEKRGMRF